MKYKYRCRNCGWEEVVHQSVHDAPLTHCGECDTHSLRRVIQPTPGYGFRKNEGQKK